MCDVTSKMPDDEELLLLYYQPSDDFIGSILVVKEKNISVLKTTTDASLVSTATQVLRHVIPSNAVIGCNTFAS